MHNPKIAHQKKECGCVLSVAFQIPFFAAASVLTLPTL